MNKNKKIKVAVLIGGPSSEHNVSLKSGEQVLKSLDKDIYEAFSVLIGKNGEWPISKAKLKEQSDVAFIAMHGTYGEDGQIQAILEEIGLPYTGSGSLTSAFAMNKFLSTRFFKYHGFFVPLSFHISKKDWDSKHPSFKTILHYLHLPFVIKPNNQGSSVGVKIVQSEKEFNSALALVFSISNEAIAQQYIEGREVTCGVLDHGWERSAYPLLPTEIVPKKSIFFDYDTKYDADAVYEITPARLPASFLKLTQEIALRIHRLIGARGFSRADMIVTSKGEIYVLEVNTIPGLTENSLLPKAAEASGIPFETLLHNIIQSAFRKN